MTTPINLNKARKAKARKQAKSRAEENAVKFGRTKAEKLRDRAEAARVTKLHDGHKRDA